jgi:hypothetical protein
MEASCMAIALAVFLKKKKRRWIKVWLKKRNEYTNENFLKDIRLSEPSYFQNFLRLDATSSDKLLKMITPRIKKKGITTMRNAIHTSQLQFFSEVSTQRFKFFNQLNFISIQKYISIFAKQMFVLFISLFCCCNSCS